MILQDLVSRKLLATPAWLPTNTLTLVTMGSIAYGVAEDTSDFDVYGYCMPPKIDIFPHLDGEIVGFSTPKKRFEQFQEHHVFDQDALGGKGREYDFTIFGIVKYFDLCMDGNPNTLDSLFVPQSCILHSTKISELVRDNRHLFLGKHIWGRFKGYAYSQLHKSTSKNPEEGSKREKLRTQYGMDTKFLYHVIRLLSECEQILETGDLDLQEDGRREHMKAIRRGEVAESDIRKWAAEKEHQLEKVYSESKLPNAPDEKKIKSLLLTCIEHHYGSLDNCITEAGWAEQALREIDDKINNIRNRLYT